MKSTRLRHKLLQKLQAVFWIYYFNIPKLKKRMELKYKDHYIHISYTKVAKQAWARERLLSQLGPRVFKLDEDF
ncbi:hypothetical protein DUE52_03200 [Larkinella punicea]|uniref:Uncharacterized protein n=1 Tax=Larkinella punicea TaxID=2315727 RepID=A0A368JUD5_9BACT|nr:hypothetical protein DUE52_03200 [Larkinella punicea]